MDQNVSFNLQQFLSEMRDEIRESHNALVEKVDAGFTQAAAAQQSHERSDAQLFATYDRRVSQLETGFSAIRWLVMTTVGAGIMLALNWVASIWTTR